MTSGIAVGAIAGVRLTVSTTNEFRDGSHCGDVSHSVTHGHTRGLKNSPIFQSWSKMLTRCYNLKSDRYKNYGGKGVRVCRRWHKFENFLSDMGERPEGKTLGRFLDRGNYSSRNCRWMTRAEQGLNMRNNHALLKWELSRATVRKPRVLKNSYCGGAGCTM